MKLILIGFMGSGKSTIAEAISQKITMPHHDLDQLIEAQAGCSIPEYFQRFGERAFRRLEHRTLIQALTLNGILSTGGGTPVQDHNFQLLVNHPTPIVFLDASDDTIMERLIQDGAQTRPLFKQLGADGILKLKHDRQAQYEQLADITIDVNDQTPEVIVQTIIANNKITNQER